MSRCEKYIELASRHLDGDLSPDEEKSLFEHLEECPDCRRYYEAMAEVSGMLQETSAPEGFAARVMGAVGAALPVEKKDVPKEGEQQRKKPLRRGAIARFAALAACLALVVAAGVKLALPSAGGANAVNGGKPATFDSTGACAQAPENASKWEEDVEEGLQVNPGSMLASPDVRDKGVDEIDAITISRDGVSTHIIDRDAISALAAILEYGEDASGLPGEQADYVLEIEGELGVSRLEIWDVDGLLVCLADDGTAWIAEGAASELESELG